MTIKHTVEEFCDSLPWWWWNSEAHAKIRPIQDKMYDAIDEEFSGDDLDFYYAIEAAYGEEEYL